MVRIKESISKLDEYRVPRDFSRIKLNQNESPFDFPVRLKMAISTRLLETGWNRYPDNFAEQLVQRLSRYTAESHNTGGLPSRDGETSAETEGAAHVEGFPGEGIMVGNSSNELIQAAMYSYSDSGDSIVVGTPGFPIYKRVASVMNIRVHEVPAKEDFKIDVEAVIAAAEKAQMVLLASPDNPTGQTLSLEEISHIAGNIKGMLLLDEAYYEFHRQTAQTLIQKFSNIIIVRTFSKAFNLAGIRLGYLLGDVAVVKEIRKAKLPFSVGMFQQLAGITALDHPEFIRDNVQKIVVERERIMAELEKIPDIIPTPSFANFILFRCTGSSAKDVFNALYEEKVVVRHYETPRLKNRLRVTIGTVEENDSFLRALQNIILKKGSVSGDSTGAGRN
ncbi:MAG: histidinol-phosphate transaminase [bacterium]|nr:histidinol-phosphate transaminase [bacterium]